MRVGELFVNLGITGAEKAAGALGSVRDGLGKITTLSTEAKLGILGLFYGLEQLTTQSNRFGLGLDQFNRLTGLSTQELQKWQYLMRQSGVSAEETTSNVTALQKAMASIALNKGAPQGITALSNVLGRDFDVKKIQDPYYMLQKFREYSKRVKEKGGGPAVEAVMNDILGSFHLTDNFLATLKTSTVDIDKIRPSELFNDREQATLSNMSIAWSNLGNQIEKSIGRLNVQFGPRLLGDIYRLVPQVFQLVKAFADLADKLRVLEGIGKVFKGWTMLLKEITDAVQVVNKEGLQGLLPSKLAMESFGKDILQQVVGPPQPTAVGNTTDVTNNINTTVQVGPGASADEIGIAAAKQINRVFNNTLRQIPQQGI